MIEPFDKNRKKMCPVCKGKYFRSMFYCGWYGWKDECIVCRRLWQTQRSWSGNLNKAGCFLDDEELNYRKDILLNSNLFRELISGCVLQSMIHSYKINCKHYETNKYEKFIPPFN